MVPGNGIVARANSELPDPTMRIVMYRTSQKRFNFSSTSTPWMLCFIFKLLVGLFQHQERCVSSKAMETTGVSKQRHPKTANEGLPHRRHNKICLRLICPHPGGYRHFLERVIAPLKASCNQSPHLRREVSSCKNLSCPSAFHSKVWRSKQGREDDLLQGGVGKPHVARSPSTDAKRGN